jgi:ABC transport system ATP-binding/permease protein
MKPIRYRIADRIADWYHGLRDGWAGIPDRDTAAQYITTPHRESLIRLAKEVFEHERFSYEQARGEAPRRIVAATARLDQLHAHQTEVERQLTEASKPLTAAEETWRRVGDVDQPERVVIQRRRTEHRRRANAVRRTLDSILDETGQVKAERARATEIDERALRDATSRVLAFHAHIHRRLDCYLRRLVRSHPDGAWASTYLIVPSFLPGWVGQVPDPQEPLTASAGTAEIPVREVDSPKPRLPASPIYLRDPETIFGSDQRKSHVVISAPGTSPKHFALTLAGDDQLRLRDFGYGHGPYRYGAQVRSALLRPGDHFDFADRRYYVLPGGRVLDDTPLGPVTLIVDDVWARTPRAGGWLRTSPDPERRTKALLTGMSFVQREDTLLAVLGPSGAGKSSLFNALIGDLMAERGSMHLAGLDMLARSPQISDKLGFVPQDIDLHATLTIRQLLKYSFHLRDPGTTFNRGKRIKKVSTTLGLHDKLNQVVATLSGGEKRRVSIAIELLSEPSLLILDEPTSGLDPGKDRELMRFLSAYATGADEADRSHDRPARTVIVSTHSTEHLEETVNEILIVADHGQPVFLGRADQVLSYAQADSWAALMVGIEPVRGKTSPHAADLAKRYQQGGEASEAHRAAADAKTRSSTRSRATGGRYQEHAEKVRRRSVRQFRRQLWTLIKRQATLLRVRGRRSGGKPSARSVFAALLPFLVAFVAAEVAALITPSSGLGSRPGGSAAIALSVLTTLAVLSGQALTYSDLVSDFPIIRREHRVGVLLPTVTLSRWLIYVAVAAIQAAIMTATFIAVGRRPGPGYSNVIWPPAELFVDLAALTIAAMSLGLLISALAERLEQAVAMITLASIAQIALNGVTAQLSPALNRFAFLFPDRWGLAAAASTVDLSKITLPPPRPADALWAHTAGQWQADLIALAILAVGYLTLATVVLQRRLRPQALPRRLSAAGRRRR